MDNITLFVIIILLIVHYALLFGISDEISEIHLKINKILKYERHIAKKHNIYAWWDKDED